MSAGDAMAIASLKGLVAGACNTGLARSRGVAWPAWPDVGAATTVGFFGDGPSLALFVVVLHTLGTARTGAYFSVAPLFGVVFSLPWWPVAPEASFWGALLLLAAGTTVHLLERHEHVHPHEPMAYAHAHAHVHMHDEHHQHDHVFEWDGREPHSHPHAHAALRHSHRHDPDIHHRHPR